jgi:hypothetical protein
MPFFADAEQLYAVAEQLIARIQQEDSGAADAVLQSRMVTRLKTTEPSAEFSLDGRRRPVQVLYGASQTRPTLTIELTGDMLHGILLGELSLKKTLASGTIKVRGPVWRVTALADLFYRGRTIYPQVLRDQGLAFD